MDIVTAESVLTDSMPPQINQDGSFLLSVKAASKHLGLSAAVVYELINRGEIAHVMIGSRRYISRPDQRLHRDQHAYRLSPEIDSEHGKEHGPGPARNDCNEGNGTELARSATG